MVAIVPRTILLTDGMAARSRVKMGRLNLGGFHIVSSEAFSCRCVCLKFRQNLVSLESDGPRRLWLSEHDPEPNRAIVGRDYLQ